MLLSLRDQSRCLVFIPCPIQQKIRKISGMRAKDVGHVLLHRAKTEVPVKTYAVSLIQTHHFQIAPCISSLGSHCNYCVGRIGAGWGQRQSPDKALCQRCTLKQQGRGRWKTCLLKYHSHISLPWDNSSSWEKELCCSVNQGKVMKHGTWWVNSTSTYYNANVYRILKSAV